MIAAVIFAGGKARRFGGVDKAMLQFKDKPLISHVIERIAPQVDILSINHPGSLPGIPYRTIADLTAEQPGPIGGLEAGIVRANALETVPDYLLTVPVDTPFLPLDLVKSLLPTAKQHGAAIAATNKGPHPTISLHRLGIIDERKLQHYRNRSFKSFWADVGAKTVLFNDENGFININCPQDMLSANKARITEE